MWIFWALFSAFCSATRRTNEKRLANQLHSITIGLMVQALSLPIVLIAALTTGSMLNPLHLGVSFWLPLLIVCVGFYPLNALLYIGAIRHGELSKVMPIQSLWAVFSLIPGWIILHEIPTLLALAGVLIIVAGVYAIGLKGRQFHHPFQPFREDKSSLFMLLAVLLVTIVGVFDKIAINASNAIFYSLMSTTGAVIVLFVAMKIMRVNELSQLGSFFSNLTATGSLQGASYTSYLMALSMGPVAFVSAVRSSSIIISSLLGVIVLKEKLTWPKIISLSLILVGGTILAVGS